MVEHILIIDAHATALEVTHALAQRLAPTAIITCTSTVYSGWLAAQRTPPDALVIDPSPFGPSGVLLIQLCKAQYPALRVVVLASVPTPGLHRQLAQLGVDVYLEKPIASARLVEQLRAGLELPVPQPHLQTA
jgi:DNA-binding NarL/FixJ family response regulator